MQKVSEDECISYISFKIPEMAHRWKKYFEITGEPIGLTVDIQPLTDYVVEKVRNEEYKDVEYALKCVEELIEIGDEDVKASMTTGFLEALLHQDPHNIQFEKFAHLLGPESKEYCKAWDEFCGMRTKGLWDDDIC